MLNNTFTTVLVTGGSGFVGTEAIVQLLQQGYKVRTTVRSLKKSNEIISALINAGCTNPDQLEFIEADLMSDRNWAVALLNCDYVLHIASPIELRIPKDENEFIQPAVNGTKRILKAARDAGVKRVVLTSNFGAVGYSVKDKTKVITEADWTDPNEKGLSAYNKSKVLAEMAAWEFIKKEGGVLELTVINPVGIFGPAYNNKLSSGFTLVKQILDGSMKAIPNMTLNIVDVRDLIDLHIRAMKNPVANGERFLALSEGQISLPEIAVFYKKHYGEKLPLISSKALPDWGVKIAALFNSKAKALVPMLNKVRNASNAKARNLLGWQPGSKEEALLATAKSLIQNGNIKVDN